jgi:hypothetical protein
VPDAARRGASIGLTFGRLHHAATGRRVMLVPAAASDAGAALDTLTLQPLTLADGSQGYPGWGVPADDAEAAAGHVWLADNMAGLAVRRANEAMAYHPVRNPTLASEAPDPANRFAGILWHHGIADVGLRKEEYRSRLAALVGRLRRGVRGASDATPFLAGAPTQAVIDAMYDRGPANVVPLIANVAYFGQPACVPVHTAGLAASSADFRTFTDDALRELGRRYHAAFVGVATPAAASSRALEASLVLRADPDAPPLVFGDNGAPLAWGENVYANASTVNGIVGNVRAVADPVRGNVIQFNNAHLLANAQITQEYTRAVWVYPTASVTGTLVGSIMGCDASSGAPFSTTAGFARASFRITASVAPNTAGVLRVFQYPGGSGLPEVTFPVNANLALNAWTHVAVTCVNVVPDKCNVSVFINGAHLASNANTLRLNVGTAGTLRPQGIGGFNGGSRFPGLMDDVRLYSRGLSGLEIAQLALFR